MLQIKSTKLVWPNTSLSFGSCHIQYGFVSLPPCLAMVLGTRGPQMLSNQGKSRLVGGPGCFLSARSERDMPSTHTALSRT